MTVEKWLNSASRKLSAAGISSSHLDCLILLEDETSHGRSWLLAHPAEKLSPLSLKRLDKKVARRIKHEPLAYIRQRCEFYGREFFIDRRVLQPRPESETMIELLEELAKNGQPDTESEHLTVIDAGTGSGVLAVSAKLEIPQAKVLAVDIDSDCLAVARKNAKLHRASIRFFQGDLLIPLPTNAYQLPLAILANLPYVPEHFQINKAAQYEPKAAIFGGKDGLDVYRRLLWQLKQFRLPGFFVIAESLPPQHRKMTAIAKDNGFSLIQTDGFVQLFQRIR